MSGWIGVDFDGTLAVYGTWAGPEHVGAPIAPMVERVKGWLAEGRAVRIFTARVYPITCVIAPDTPLTVPVGNGFMQPEDGAKLAALAIRQWCREHIGEVLPITCVKDYGMVELYDDRAVQVRPNTGEIVGHSTRGLL